ncbi:MAG: secE [Solirubrobacterales bacterium]|nr:secE [Solirubrobacterales bacterium]
MARDRKRRRKGGENPGPEPTEPHRENVPGEWDHSSGEEEVFEAGIVSGAGGDESEISDEELARQAQEATGRPAVRATAKGAPQKTGGPRLVQFFRGSWAELQRVQWPDRRQVTQATAVVLGFVVIAGAYLGLADAAAQKFIDFIL